MENLAIHVDYNLESFHVECIFCKIIEGKVQCHKVYENENFLVFLDKFPKTPGHCQVIPKKHYRWVWDVPDLGDYFKTCGKIAKAMQKAFNTEMVQSRIVGDEVHHAHIWLLPIHSEKVVADVEVARRISSEIRDR